LGSTLAAADAATSVADTQFEPRPQMPWEARYFAAKGVHLHGQLCVVAAPGIREDFGEGDEEVRRRQIVAPLEGTMIAPGLGDPEPEQKQALVHLDTLSTYPPPAEPPQPQTHVPVDGSHSSAVRTQHALALSSSPHRPHPAAISCSPGPPRPFCRGRHLATDRIAVAVAEPSERPIAAPGLAAASSGLSHPGRSLLTSSQGQSNWTAGGGGG